MWFQRDQFTNSQIYLSDLQLIRQQHFLRLSNHPASERSKASGSCPPASSSVQVGDLVYITSDASKTRARDRYHVVPVDGSWCNVRKFAGTQLRSTSYRIKLSECYRVPDQMEPVPHPTRRYCPDVHQDIVNEESTIPSSSPHPRPVIPPLTPAEFTFPPDPVTSTCSTRSTSVIRSPG